MSEVNDLTDEKLMEEYQNGNETAFTILYKKHSAKIYGFLLAKLRNKAFADDVFQSVFLKIHQSRNQYDSTRPLMPWIFTICQNVMIDNIRKQKHFFKENNSDKLDLILSPEVQSPSGTLPLESMASRLPHFDHLSENQRQVLELRYHNELSFEEIAKKLKITPLNVRQITSRAIKKLQMLTQKMERKK